MAFRECIDRWKVYQFTPFSYGETFKEDHEIDYQEFMGIAQYILTQFPNLPVQIAESQEQSGRYLFIGPEGNIFGVNQSQNYEIVGNAKQDSFDDILRKIQPIFHPELNKKHGIYS